ncbi:polyketide synthase [Longimycelium tulufanense]|uniref:Polyketide synthase n=1 Tax=Longimycelium tulufanense TaxID=907463 RepID=A0A8J3CDA6_9PSEU|nr:polyketide synthase [Longimycelium tulufanense]
MILPGAGDLQTYWHNLVNGVDAITQVPDNRWDPVFYRPEAAQGPARAHEIYCRRGGFVDEFAEIDVTQFGIMPASIPGTEPDQFLALKVAADAITDAGGADRLPTDRDRIGVILGRGGYMVAGQARLAQRVSTAAQLVRTLGQLLPELTPEQLERVRAAYADHLGPEHPESAIGLVPNLTASRIANRLDLRGPAYTVDAACASSLVAVEHAVRELASGHCDVVLAGGVHHCHDISFWSVFSQLRALSPTEAIRPFDRRADGVLIGEGTGVVLLKRLADAERDGDRIYAVIRGTGVASDGRAASLFNPDPGGQERAVRQAWRMAGLDPTAPDALGLLEAHGTATPAGDAAELSTVAAVFGPDQGDGARNGARPIIGSVKSMIGHAMPAAGVAGLVKAALAVYHGTLLPTLHCDDPHPTLARTRFRPITRAEPWETDGQRVRRAGVNAFGFGGINAHVILEQAPSGPALVPPPRVSVREPERVLRLTADSPEQLAQLLDADDTTVLAAGSDRNPEQPGRTRLGVVEPTARKLSLARRIVGKGRPWRGRNDIWFTPTPLLSGDAPGKVAFVFPGLEAEFRPRADDIVDLVGLPDGLHSYVSPTDDPIAAGDVTRHALGVLGLGRLLDSALHQMKIVPDAVAGHSIGEWIAMVTSGLLGEDAATGLLDTVDPDVLHFPSLVFAAIGAPAERVLEALTDWDGIVLSHDNAPNQSVVCGSAERVEEFVRWFRARNVLSQTLPFRSGFHTPMLEPYLAPARESAEQFEFHTPTVPIWSGTTAAPYPDDHAAVRRLFIRHLLEPVRFRPLIAAMYDAGFRVFVQVGLGQLGALVDDVLHGQEHLAISAATANRDGLAQLSRVATALWVDGGAPDTGLLGERPVSGRGHAGEQAQARQRNNGRRPTKLDLGCTLISLEDEARQELAPLFAGKGSGSGADLSTLDGFVDRFPAAGQLQALLKETADTAAAVIAAGTRGPDPTRPAQPAAPTQLRTTLRVSLEDMPYLRDHSLLRQPADWPDDGDRFPVVPATTLIGHMMEFAEQAAPGRKAVAVHDVQLFRWVTAVPAVDLPVTVTPEGTDRVAVTFGQYCRATVELTAGYPQDPPAPWRPEQLGAEQQPELTGKELYTRRWMFHGPRFQGVSELVGVGESHVRGVITTPPAPGSLLDNAGQVFGYWPLSRLTERSMVLPIGLRRARFFGPHPEPGTRLDCLVRYTTISDSQVVGDIQLVADGRVWAELTGWRDRRFESNFELDRHPDRTALARRQAGGWTLLFEGWPDGASRDMFLRRHFNDTERAEFEGLSPRGRRHWVLGRLVVKDAVRQWLWEHGEDSVFPIEIQVGNDATGRPVVAGWSGRTLPGLNVSLAHRAEAGVALVRPAGGADQPGVGIDIEEIADRAEGAHRLALGDAERELLTARAAGGEEALWFTRFWAAKEAVAKAEGTGLQGRPRGFAVIAAGPTELVVTAGTRRYRVHCTEVANPPGLPARQYVVAWTAGPTSDEEADG